MQFPDFPMSNDISFPTHSDVLKYLHSYADHFDLNKNIKLNHLVYRVIPVENEKWEVIIKDLANNKFITKIYDSVFICNGHFFSPFIPQFEGTDQFRGNVIHSKNYRLSEAFRGTFNVQSLYSKKKYSTEFVILFKMKTFL